ncbi:MAG: N-acetylglucosamine-6-phosphate deacetylase [Bacillota bacterium]|jgi:N-acetylglucosamine-6-phosphate deacetylase|nr:N-acetylglucosamine-6-phosphate deacetylase [Bacillota bacterium]NLM31423.1 N-acetylglucosamine-6-phosphate deacetylase [Acholeplasmataceae bacterium]HOA78664.1 N-acetylglucosamine-6-phosphate deacetylase [Bacilli bacterium]HPZ27172.1 N-acetylglucosamine-6-phosphate deacetylase [Bacilli bacterium]HQC88846.1 N-acetylglucosamine-6-phosphate deacetylase [Bacilli bacterium]
MEIKGFKNTYVYFEGDGIIKSGFKVENKKIAPIDSDADGLLELDDKYIVIPGFIDKHIHGANHSDAMYPTYDDISNIAKSIAQEGVTGFLPTTMTQSKENVAAALKNIRIYIEQDNDEGAAVLGIHLEGPFISKKYKGSQHEQYILADDIETMKYFQEVSGNNIRHVTFAYEENGREFTEYLVKQGIVASIGHSDATAADVFEAVKAGVTSVTHVYNAMRGLHHREAGVLGASLLADELYCELIADLIHVSPEAIRILYKMKGKDKIVLVTDAIESKHLSDGVYQLGGQDVYVKAGEARLASGVLAGSNLTMNKAVKNFIDVTGVFLTEAVDMATINPARVLKIDGQKGSIKFGKDADFAVIDKDLNVYLTVRGGKVIYNRLIE